MNHGSGSCFIFVCSISSMATFVLEFQSLYLLLWFFDVIIVISIFIISRYFNRSCDTCVLFHCLTWENVQGIGNLMVFDGFIIIIFFDVVYISWTVWLCVNMKNCPWVLDFQTLSCSKFDEELVWTFFMMRHDSCGLVCPFFGRVSCSKTVARWHWGHECPLRRHIHRRGQPGPCACSADTLKGDTKRCNVWFAIHVFSIND